MGARRPVGEPLEKRVGPLPEGVVGDDAVHQPLLERLARRNAPADVAYDQEYVGWMAVYQALRLKAGMPLYEVEGKDEYHVHGGNVPWKLFVQDDVEEPIEEYSSDAAIGWKAQLGKTMGVTGAN